MALRNVVTHILKATSHYFRISKWQHCILQRYVIKWKLKRQSSFWLLHREGKHNSGYIPYRIQDRHVTCFEPYVTTEIFKTSSGFHSAVLKYSFGISGTKDISGSDTRTKRCVAGCNLAESSG